MSKVEGLDVATLQLLVDELQRQGIDLGYRFVSLVKHRVSKDLQLDLNLLKVMELVVEIDGKLFVTERGRAVLRKAIERGLIPQRLASTLDIVAARVLEAIRRRS